MKEKTFIEKETLFVYIVIIFLSITKVSLSQAPANDNCAGAQLLTLAPLCSPMTNGDLFNATSSGISTSCGSSLKDVWYRFVAVATNQRVSVVTSGTGFDAVFQVYKNSCAGVSINCTDAQPNGTTESTCLSGLTVGNTYWIRVTNNIDPCSFCNFGICIEMCSNTGIEEDAITSPVVTISPNPFNSSTTISFSSEQKNTTIKIIDVVGREIMNDKLLIINGRSATLDMSGYAKGVYIIRIEDEKKNVVNRKVVLQ